jgi:hypothetical protein
MICKENVFKSVLQHQFILETLIPIGAFKAVLPKDINMLTIVKDHACHIVQLLTWEIYMLTIRLGHAFPFVLQSKTYTALNIPMILQFELVFLLVLFLTILSITLPTMFPSLASQFVL